MRKPKQITAYENTCNECQYKWANYVEEAPSVCPNCKTRTWNGAKKRGRKRSITILSPAPKKVRLA